MPDWIDYPFSYEATPTNFVDTRTSASSDYWTTNISLTATQAQQQFEEYQREYERQDRAYELQMQMFEQQMEEEKQLIKDKEKYPLFFLKEGIV